MGNSLGGKKSAKVMKISGETFKVKTPVRAGLVVENHPGHVLLESEAVRHDGVKAKPLEPQQELRPKRLYYLVQLPKYRPQEQKLARRASSGIQMSAKDRLQTLMLARRSASELPIMKPVSVEFHEEKAGVPESGEGGVRIRLRLPKAEVEKLMAETKDAAEVTEKIVNLCRAGGGAAEQNVHWKGDCGSAKRGSKSREKRVGFLPTNEGDIHLALAS